MPLPTPVQDSGVHCKKQMLPRVAAKVCSGVMVCQIFSVSRHTFSQYRRQEQAGKLTDISCAPRQHGLAKSQAGNEAVLQARAPFPGAGKKR